METIGGTPDATESDYILIQSLGLLMPSQRLQLAGMGLILHSYVSKNTYLYGYHRETDLEKIRRLKFIAYVDVYIQGFKIDPFLKKWSPSKGFTYSNEPPVVDIVFHEDVDTESKTIKAKIAKMAHKDIDSLEFGKKKVRLALEKQDWDAVASVDEVRRIELVHKVKPRSNVALTILKAGGGQHFDDLEANCTYQGTGQVVAVADNGFDTGHVHNYHTAFGNRVVALHSMSDIPLVNDIHGHGTHVCGLVLGDGRDQNNDRIRGTAPNAKLVVQCLGSSYDGIPTDLGLLFEHPYSSNGVRVHTNSWGASYQGEQLGYTRGAGEIDAFVHKHEDMVILFAAGNDGTDSNRDGIVDQGQIGAEAAAKNCITVGASENVRPEIEVTYGENWPDRFPIPPISGHTMAGHKNRVAAFSSRGPIRNSKRIKPDVVAPGTMIYSAGSGHLHWPKRLQTRPSEWCGLSGTSQATPLVAGCAAVLREAVIAAESPSYRPSASLIKALLVNGAVSLSNKTPNNDSGFGRVDLANSLTMASKEDGAGFLVKTIREPSEGRYRERRTNIEITDKRKLKVTLVWTDVPGAQLTQKLHLVVQDVHGAKHYGNRGIRRGRDNHNNVQQVDWRDIPAGAATIRVRTTSLPMGPQSNAIVWGFYEIEEAIQPQLSLS